MKLSYTLTLALLISIPVNASVYGALAQGSDSSQKSPAPTALDLEKKSVNETLTRLTKAFVNSDLETISGLITEDIVSTNESTHQVFRGKKAVLENLKDKFEEYSATGKKPLISFDIVKPVITIEGDTAVAKYKAFAEIGGHRPFELYSEITEVFLKQDGVWKSYRYNCHWTEEKGKELDKGQINPEGYLKLKAGVKTLLVSLHGIKDLGHDVKRARRGLAEYTREATKKKLVVVPCGNEVGPIILESEDPNDMYLPARKSHLELYLRELNTLIRLMQDDVDSLESGALTLIVRKDIKEEMETLIDEWSAKVKSASKHCRELNKVTSKHIEDNAMMAKSAKTLKRDLDDLRIIQKKMVAVFRKPIRSIR